MDIMGAHELAFVGLAGSSVGTVLGVPMVWPRADRRRDIQLFGIAMLLMSLISGLISARLAGLAPSTESTARAINLLGLLTSPLLVMYARYAAVAPITRRQAAWWAPAIAYVLLITLTDTRVPFAWLAPVVYGFTIASAITLWRHRERRSVIVPAEAVVAFCILLNVAQFVRMQWNDFAVVRALVPIVMSLGFAALAAYASARIAMPRSAAAIQPRRYERSGLDQISAGELLARIERALKEDRVFTRVDLTLAQFAIAVDATPHQVSEALNLHGGTSFTDLITKYRVEDVKAQLLDPANDNFTIEGIGASAGFGSRSALYAAFRRLQGMTPAQFRDTHRH